MSWETEDISVPSFRAPFQYRQQEQWKI